MLCSRRKKPPVQYVRCEMEGCGTVLAHPRYLQVCLSHRTTVFRDGSSCVVGKLLVVT